MSVSKPNAPAADNCRRRVFFGPKRRLLGGACRDEVAVACSAEDRGPIDGGIVPLIQRAAPITGRLDGDEGIANGPGSDTGWFSLDGGNTWNDEGPTWDHAFKMVP